ncbi:MAG: hypothetical protein AB8V06_03045 [Francisella endosymbiont of Hyalomma asiaticum]
MQIVLDTNYSQGNAEIAPIKIFATENAENRGFTNFIYDGITSVLLLFY